MKCVSFCFFTSLFVFFLLSCNTVTKKSIAAKKMAVINDSIYVKCKLIVAGLQIPLEINEPENNSERKFITDNSGKIWILKNDSLLSKPFFNIYDKIGKPTKNPIIGTIFSVAFDPQYATNRKFYVCYNAPSKIHKANAQLVVSEFTADKTNPDIADLKSEYRIIEFNGPKARDNGSQIAFGPDGYLYISIGDENAGDSTYHYRAHNLKYLDGKLLRIDVNKTPYAIPPDNPFVGVKDARPEIWAYGFRKLWRFSFDPLNHQIFGGDVGENREEEIDIVTRGSDYGWPVREGDSSFEKNNLNSQTSFTAPINTYTHKVGICVIGGSFYYGNEIASLKNKYVFADWSGNMFSLKKSDSGNWIRQPLKIVNKPSGSFFICGCSADVNNQLFIMGYLVVGKTEKGVIYKIENI
ncbi:MAG TPA: PQQ-dependent sugar dehydrogenase [Hanamia sp.]